MLKKLVTGSIVVVLAASGLAAGSAAARLAPTTAPTKAPTISMPASARVNASFNVTVHPRGQVGKLRLLRRSSDGTWRTVATKNITKKTGRVVLKRREKHAGTVAYRAQLGPKRSPVDRILIRPATPPPPPPPEPELLMSVGATTEDVFVGDSYTVYAEAVQGDDPLPGLSVVIDTRVGATGPWVPVGTFTTDGEGVVQVPQSSDEAGLIFYRGTSGTLTGQTLITVFETVDMPATPGPSLAVAAQGCGAGIVGDGSQVSLLLRNTPPTPPSTGHPGDPGCPTKVGDFVQSTWTLGSGCSTVRITSISLDGSPGVGVNVRVTIDGQQLLNRDVARLGTTGRFEVNGDPMESVVIRMTVTAGPGGDFTGILAEPEAVCT